MEHGLRRREERGRADDETGQGAPLQRSEVPLSPLLSCRGAVSGVGAQGSVGKMGTREDRAEGQEKQVWSPGGKGQLPGETCLRPPTLAPHLSLSRRGEGDIRSWLTLCSQNFGFNFNPRK